MSFLKDKRYIWMILGLVAIIIKWLATFSPNLMEIYYSRGLFLGLRWLADHSITKLTVPPLYLSIILIFFIIALHWMKIRRSPSAQSPKTWKTRLANFAKSTGAILGGIIFFFMFFWGFNYGRIPLEKQLELPVDSLSLADIKTETLWATQQAVIARRAIVNRSTFALSDTLLPKDLEPHLRELLENVLTDFGYPTTGEVRVRQIRPKGVLMRFGTAGIYWPFVFEGHMDVALHPLQKPFTMAHEMAHGYGIANEGSCNFLAYVTCMNSDNAYVRYAGKLAYWRYIASEYKFFEPEEYAIFRERHLSRGMHNDLEAIYTNGEKYPDIFPQEDIYDAFLKAQGLEDGIKSYSRVVVLLRAWRTMPAWKLQQEKTKFQ